MRFDIDRYLSTVAPLDDADIDDEAFRTRPLDDDTLRCLRYMHDVEHHTTCYLRDLLVTSAHEDTDETDHLVRHLFAGDDGRRMAQRIDRRIDRLPGLAGLGLVDGVRRSTCNVPRRVPRPGRQLAPA